MSNTIDSNISKLINLNSALDVNTERLETYLDFLTTLTMYVFETYPGDGVMLESDENIANHFRYCWESASEDFEIENIRFKPNDNLYNLFYADICHRFYYNENRGNDNDETLELIKNNIIRTYLIMLNPIKKRDKASYTNFVSLYFLFEKNIGVKH